MRVTRLRVTNLRGIEAAEFRFQPGCNLIVGVNGVGKTSILDALAVCLSAVVKDANGLRTSVESFTVDDIRIGRDALTLECEVSIGDAAYTYLLHKPREASTPQTKKSGMVRDQVHVTPERVEYLGDRPKLATGQEPEGRPLAVLFSTRRAVSSERAPAKGVASGGISAAYAGAFSDRELRLGEFAAWMRVRLALGAENPASKRVLEAFENAVRRFLPDYRNLRAVDEERLTLMIDRGDTALEVRQLSDGERGTLALVLDLTRRLAQANPNISDPAAGAEAVVMIDEIDLHLHPRWQRQILRNLAVAFPKCQFIATTHSPQVIGEVQHDHIQIIAHGLVYSPTHSFGVDSSRVLEEIMESGERTEAVEILLTDISRAVDEKHFKQARKLLATLTDQVGENDAEVVRAKALLEFMEEEK